MYRDFEVRHRQALWEATHAIYLPAKQRDRDPKLARIYQHRKQRRSRSGPRWKTVSRFIFQGMIDGHCDLDLFLDPFFMHLKSPVEMRPWYPGLGDSPKNIPNLISALARLNTAEPWRNKFRSRIKDHPGSSIARLSGKLFPKYFIAIRQSLFLIAQYISIVFFFVDRHINSFPLHYYNY